MTGVRKSYAGAGKFVSAAKMGKKKLQSSTHKGMYKPRPFADQIGVDPWKIKDFVDSGKKNGSRYPGNAANVVNPFEPVKTNLPRIETTIKGRRVNIMRTKDLPKEVRGYATTYGGKRGVSNVVMNDDGDVLRKYGPKVDGRYFKHELGHAAPKRSSWRLSQQVVNNPRKLGREEGRVDFNAGFRYKNKPKMGDTAYNEIARSPGFLMPGDTREFRSGYIDVQNRLARVQRRNVKKDAGITLDDVAKSNNPKVRRFGSINTFVVSGDKGLRMYRPSEYVANAKGKSLIRRRPTYRVDMVPSETPKLGSGEQLYLQRNTGYLGRKNRQEMSDAIRTGANRLSAGEKFRVNKAFGSSIARSVPRLGTGTKPMMAPVRTGPTTGVMKPLKPKPPKAGISPTLTKPKYGG